MPQNDLMEVEQVAVDDLLDLQFGGFYQADHVQIGDKADFGKKRRSHGFDFSKQPVGVFGMVDDNNLSPGFTDPEHLPAKLEGITDRGDHVGGDHGIEGVVIEGHPTGIHDLQINFMSVPHPGDPVFGPLDHPGGNINPHDMAMFGVMAEGQPGPDADLQYFLVVARLQVGQGQPSPGFQHLPKY